MWKGKKWGWEGELNQSQGQCWGRVVEWTPQASSHAKLPWSNEYMSLGLKAVWQQVFKICNRKATLSGGGLKGGKEASVSEGDRREREEGGERERRRGRGKREKKRQRNGEKRQNTNFNKRERREDSLVISVVRGKL